MKCSFCGNEVAEDAKFCPICGAEISEESNTDNSQSATQYEDPNAHFEENQGNSYSEPVNNQGGYSYGQSGNNQNSYGGDQPVNNQGSYGYGQPTNNQNSYGNWTMDGNQGGYGYGQPGNGQNDYGNSQPNNQGGYNYSQPNGYGQAGNNFNQPVKQISGTPYLVFSILVTLCCCLPLGIASIIYASKINSLQKMGDYAGAKDAAKKAKILMIVGAVGGLILSVGIGVSGALDEILNTVTDSTILSDGWDDDEEDDDEDDKVEPKKDVEVSGDLGDSWKSFTIQINDSVLTFPCAVSEIEAAGLALDTDDVAEDYIINRDDYELVYFEDANDNDIMFVVSNNTDEALTVKECTVTGIYVSDYDVENSNLNFVFPGGIQLGASIDDVIAKWGEPSDSYDGDYSDSYYWYDDNSSNYCSVSVEPETGKVTTIDLDGQDLK